MGSTLLVDRDESLVISVVFVQSVSVVLEIHDVDADDRDGDP
jgi:hypothetical protein